MSDTAPETPPFEAKTQFPDRVDWGRAIGQQFAEGDPINKPQDWARYKYRFIYGQSDPTLFDHANWRLCAIRALDAKDFNALTSDHFDRDDPILLEFIARHTPRQGYLCPRGSDFGDPWRTKCAVARVPGFVDSAGLRSSKIRAIQRCLKF